MELNTLVIGIFVLIVGPSWIEVTNMKCNYKPPKLTKEEQQEFASMKSTLPYIDRLQIQWRNSESIEELEEDEI